MEGTQKGEAVLTELPPPVTEDQFQFLEGSNKEQVRERAAPFVRDLHAFLNRGSCLRDIQRIRRRLNPRIKSGSAFEDFAADREHWYTHNAGGRSEAQFNVGLFTDYLRVGLAFESSKKVHGDPEAVQRMYDSFTARWPAERPSSVPGSPTTSCSSSPCRHRRSKLFRN